MPSTVPEPLREEASRSELQAVLQSPVFARSPSLAHLLSYLCEKVFSGDSSQVKEYSIALEVFGRPESFDQDADSIVRVQANRLRKRLAEYYAHEGATHRIHIAVPLGQYVPVFQEVTENPSESSPSQTGNGDAVPPGGYLRIRRIWPWFAAAMFIVMSIVAVQERGQKPAAPASTPNAQSAPSVGLPVGDEIRILAGSGRTYVDRSGKSWSSDQYFSGGTMVRSPIQHIWRTQDPSIYRTSRQGDFKYDIPLKRGVYELHLHFAELFYGPEDAGGGEGSRVMAISANGISLLSNFDVAADAGAARTADVKVFTDMAPAADGFLHLSFSSLTGGSGMVSGIEILPGIAGKIRPVRIVARDVPYYSNDSQWWSSDIYFKGGQLAASEEPAQDTDDPELYETERWGNFSYAIPVTSGKYTVTLQFVDRSLQRVPGAGTQEGGTFSVYCNGQAVITKLNISDAVGRNRPLARRISGIAPNEQGKLLLDFVPSSQYATISAIEVLPQ